MEPTLRRAINATLMPGFTGPRLPDWLASELGDGLGSVCLFATNIVEDDQLRRLTAAIHAAGAACLIATDEEGGDVTRLHHRRGSPFPSAAYLGAVDSPALTTATTAAIGAQLRAVGIDLNLAPVADVNSNPRNPVIGVRSFGTDAALVARHVAAATEGLHTVGIGAVAKHFPGHGDTATDSHLALPVLDRSLTELEAVEFLPFRAAIEAGTLAIMTSHILVPALDPDLPATFSPAVLGLLRAWGFDGVILSDALDMAGASAERGLAGAAVSALAAGVDLLCLGTHTSQAELAAVRAAIAAAVASGELRLERLTDAARRVATLAHGLAELRAGASRWPAAPRIEASRFWIRRPMAPLRAPVLIRLETTANIAAGDTAWGIGPHLGDLVADRLPGAVCASASTLGEVSDLLAAHPDRPIVIQGRDLARVSFLRHGVDLIRQRRPDAILVELGWPELPGDPPLDIVTYGAGRGAATALITLLQEGTH